MTCHHMADVCACVHASARVWACVISGLNIYEGFSLTHYKHVTYLPIRLGLFLSCGTIFLFYIFASDVARSKSFDRRELM